MDLRPRMTRAQFDASSPEPARVWLHYDETRQVATEELGRGVRNPVYEIDALEVINGSGSDVNVVLNQLSITVQAGESVTHHFSAPKPRTPGSFLSISRGARRV